MSVSVSEFQRVNVPSTKVAFENSDGEFVEAKKVENLLQEILNILHTIAKALPNDQESLVVLCAMLHRLAQELAIIVKLPDDADLTKNGHGTTGSWWQDLWKGATPSSTPTIEELKMMNETLNQTLTQISNPDPDATHYTDMLIQNANEVMTNIFNDDSKHMLEPWSQALVEGTSRLCSYAAELNPLQQNYNESAEKLVRLIAVFIVIYSGACVIVYSTNAAARTAKNVTKKVIERSISTVAGGTDLGVQFSIKYIVIGAIATAAVRYRSMFPLPQLEVPPVVETIVRNVNNYFAKHM
jgi:hypothetical protein